MSARKPFAVADGNRMLPPIRSAPPKRQARPKTAQEWASIDNQYDFLTNPESLLLDAETPRISNCDADAMPMKTTTITAAAFVHNATGLVRVRCSHPPDPAARPHPPPPPPPLLTHHHHRKSKHFKNQKGPDDDAYATLRQKRKLLWKKGFSLASIPESVREDGSDESSHTSSSSDDDSRMDISSEESDEEEGVETSGNGVPDATNASAACDGANMSCRKSPPHPVQANRSAASARTDETPDNASQNAREAVAPTTAPVPLSHQMEHAALPKEHPSILDTPASTENRGLDHGTMPSRQAFDDLKMMEEIAPSTNSTVSTGASLKPLVFPKPSAEAFTPNSPPQSEDGVTSATESSSNRLKDVSDYTATQRQSTTPPNLPTRPACDETASRIKTGAPTIPSPTGTHTSTAGNSNPESIVQARLPSRDSAQQDSERMGNVQNIGNATSKNQRAAAEPEQVQERPRKKVRLDLNGDKTPAVSTKTQGFGFENQDSSACAVSAAASVASIAEGPGSKILHQTVSAAVTTKPVPLDPVAKLKATPPAERLSPELSSKPAFLDHGRLQDDTRGSLPTETMPIVQKKVSEVPNQEKRINRATLASNQSAIGHSAPESLRQEGVAGSPTQHSNRASSWNSGLALGWTPGIFEIPGFHHPRYGGSLLPPLGLAQIETADVQQTIETADVQQNSPAASTMPLSPQHGSRVWEQLRENPRTPSGKPDPEEQPGTPHNNDGIGSQKIDSQSPQHSAKHDRDQISNEGLSPSPSEAHTATLLLQLKTSQDSKQSLMRLSDKSGNSDLRSDDCKDESPDPVNGTLSDNGDSLCAYETPLRLTSITLDRRLSSESVGGAYSSSEGDSNASHKSHEYSPCVGDEHPPPLALLSTERNGTPPSSGRSEVLFKLSSSNATKRLSCSGTVLNHQYNCESQEGAVPSQPESNRPYSKSGIQICKAVDHTDRVGGHGTPEEDHFQNHEDIVEFPVQEYDEMSPLATYASAHSDTDENAMGTPEDPQSTCQGRGDEHHSPFAGGEHQDQQSQWEQPETGDQQSDGALSGGESSGSNLPVKTPVASIAFNRQISSRMTPLIVSQGETWNDGISVLGQDGASPLVGTRLPSLGGEESSTSERAGSWMSHRVRFPPHPLCSLQRIETLPLGSFRKIRSSRSKTQRTSAKLRSYQRDGNAPANHQKRSQTRRRKRGFIIPPSLRK